MGGSGRLTAIAAGGAMTISDQAPPLELLPTRQRPAAHSQGRLPGPRLAGLQVDP